MRTKKQLDESPLKLSELSALESVSDDYSQLGQDYVLSHITANVSYFYSPQVRRIDGLTIILCLKGDIKITVDLDTIVVPPHSLLFVASERVIKPVEWRGDQLEVYLFFLSNKFAEDLNIDLNTINTNIFTSANSMLSLSIEQTDLLTRYFEMLLQVRSNVYYTRHITRALVTAAAYQVMAYSEEAFADSATGQPSSRKLAYVKTFLRLVRSYYRRERSIGFYARKMEISPKYLSLIIKEATGRTAAEWIDQYVLKEAKNLLRYSGKNVQEVAYELNFSNQSSFGKYFKHLTGLSPTQFQNC